jgi:hypothetical protein
MDVSHGLSTNRCVTNKTAALLPPASNTDPKAESNGDLVVMR